MKSARNLAERPSTLPLLADDLLEFHAARLLLLLKLCGTDGRIRGLTKMAKLDFFVRYPKFFSVVQSAVTGEAGRAGDLVESSMVRYHYGPWDQRYYHVLAYLEARGLLEVTRDGNTFELALTPTGDDLARQLDGEVAFAHLSEHMRRVNALLGRKTGSQLKRLVYETFEQEVAQLALGEVIR